VGSTRDCIASNTGRAGSHRRPVFFFLKEICQALREKEKPQLARAFRIAASRFYIPAQQFLQDARKNFGDARACEFISKKTLKTIAACVELCNYALEHSHRLPATGS
jgi:hypothetical protein